MTLRWGAKGQGIQQELSDGQNSASRRPIGPRLQEVPLGPQAGKRFDGKSKIFSYRRNRNLLKSLNEQPQI